MDDLHRLLDASGRSDPKRGQGEEGARYAPPGAQRLHDPNHAVEFVRGEGVYVWDAQGQRYLDFLCGYSSTLFGHSHPRLVAAAIDQLSRLDQVVGLRHPWRQRLEESLVAAANLSYPAKVWLATSGARAVEIAWKLAAHWRPGQMVRLDGAYHGRSLATALISDTQRLSIVTASIAEPLPFPDCQNCPLGKSRTTCRAECLSEAEFEGWIRQHASTISSVIVEPALGARGYYYAPNAFFHRLRRITADHGILLIDDEIQMGMGRLGGLFAAQQQGWEADLYVLGKSLGGGITPISAVIGRAEILDRLPAGIESETFAANPLACRVAVESLSLFEDEQLETRSAMIHRWLRHGLRRLQQASPLPLLVDSQGASATIEIDRRWLAEQVLPPANANRVETPKIIEIQQTITRQWVDAARRRGLLVSWSGRVRDRIVLIPPLIATPEHIQDAFTILEEVVREQVPPLAPSL